MPDTLDKPQRIDVGAQQGAAVYAKALLGATEKAGATEAAVADLEAIVVQVLDRHPKLEAVLGSARIAHVEKAAMLDRMLAGRVSPILLNFLKVMSRHGRLDLVRAVHAAARDLVDVMRGRVSVEVRTVQPLSAPLAAHLTERLSKILDAQPRLAARLEPGLIGGMILRVGDKVFDASIATQLKRVQSEMINRSVHEIQSRRDRFRHSGGN